MQISFDIYGVQATVGSRDPDLWPELHKIQNDFHFFTSSPHLEIPRIQIVLEKSGLGAPTDLGSPLFKTKMCQVFGWGSPRTCIYDPQHWLRWEKNESQILIKIFGLNPDLIFEMLWMSLISSVGWELESLGFMRLHALSFSHNRQTSIIQLPSGGGKSSLAHGLLRRHDCQIFSDEIVLFDGAKIFPFPIRISLTQDFLSKSDLPSESRAFPRKIYPTKFLTKIPSEQIASKSEPQFLWIGRGGFARQESFKAASLKLQISHFFSSLLGLGLPQMAEFHLRVDEIPRIFKIFGLRLLRLIQLRQQTDLQEIILGQDQVQNIEMLLRRR